MPFHIDKFRGSPEVQAMHPAARCGYLYLLASAWQSSDCSLPGDELGLATESGLGDELWALHGKRVMRKFRVRDDGRVTNDVLLKEWSEAHRVYQKRRSGAVRTNDARSASDERTHTERRADTHTSTETETETSTEKKQKPSRVKAASVPDPRHATFRKAFDAYYRHKTGSEPPWDARQAKSLGDFLKANPTWDDERWKTMLQNRARSSVAHGDALSTWIVRAPAFATDALDQFGKPIGGNTHGTLQQRPTKAELSNRTTQLGRELFDAQQRGFGVGSAHSGRTVEARRADGRTGEGDAGRLLLGGDR